MPDFISGTHLGSGAGILFRACLSCSMYSTGLGTRSIVLGADREACALAVALYHDADPVWPHWQCNEVQQPQEEQHRQSLWHHICRLVLTNTVHSVHTAACYRVDTCCVNVCAAPLQRAEQSAGQQSSIGCCGKRNGHQMACGNHHVAKLVTWQMFCKR